MAGDGERVVQGGGFGSGVGADCQSATGQGYVAVDALDFVVVESVGWRGEDTRYLVPLFERMFGGYKQRVIRWNADAVFDCCQSHADFLEHHLGVSLSPLKVLFRRPSVFAYAVFMFEVVKESEELCYFLSLWIVFQVEELPLYMLQAWQAFYPAHPADSYMPVSRVIVALEGSVEAFYVLLEDSAEREPSS